MAGCLVTGGAGFIGSHIVQALVDQGEPVRVLDNFSTGRAANLRPVLDRIDLLEGDIRSAHSVRQAVRGVQTVFHLAALPSVPRSIDDPLTTHEVNATGTLHLLDAAREAGVRRFVYASSSSVYGNAGSDQKTEDMTSAPLSPYAVSKLSGETYCQVFYRIYGLETVVLRYFNVFGPGQNPESRYAAVIPRFVRSIRSGESPVIYGDGLQSRDFTWVGNVVQANLLARDAAADRCAGEIFNIACGESVTVNRLFETLRDLLNRPGMCPEYRDPRPGEVMHSRAGIAKAMQRLGYRPHVLFAEGMALLVSAPERM